MSESLIFSLIVGASVGLAAGYLGSIMVLEKMALVGDAMSHVALPGLALGVLLGFSPLLGGFLFLFVSAILIWHVSRVTKLSFETLVGAAFTLALAIGILLFKDLDALEAALFGDIAQVTLLSAGIAIAASAAVILLTRLIYKKIVLGLISEELAISKGISIAKTNLLYLLLVSVTVAIGIQITGTLLYRVPCSNTCCGVKNHQRKHVTVPCVERNLRRNLSHLWHFAVRLLQRSAGSARGYFGRGNLRGCLANQMAQENRILNDDSCHKWFLDITDTRKLSSS